MRSKSKHTSGRVIQDLRLLESRIWPKTVCLVPCTAQTHQWQLRWKSGTAKPHCEPLPLLWRRRCTLFNKATSTKLKATPLKAVVPLEKCTAADSPIYRLISKMNPKQCPKSFLV